MSHTNIKMMAETAILSALAFALSFLTINLAETFYIEFAVIPVIFLALRRGLRWGFIGGLVLALLFLITGKVSTIPMKSAGLQYLDLLLEYGLAPISLGLAGIFKKRQVKLSGVLAGALVASLVKYFWHFLAGGIFWASYVPKGWNPWAFSFVTQGLSGILTALVAAVVLGLIFKAAPQLLFSKKEK